MNKSITYKIDKDEKAKNVIRRFLNDRYFGCI